MKRIGDLKSTPDAPLTLLYEQGIAYETFRAAYWSVRGNAERMMDATARAAHYQAAWESLDCNAHRYLPPQNFR
jgi:hypothetical protein